MDWFSLHFTSEIPAGTSLIIESQLNSLLLTLSCLVSCAAIFASLTLGERIASAQTARGRRFWAAAGAVCLGGGVWAVHVEATLALEAPLHIGYDLGFTLVSLLIGVLVAWVAMTLIGKQHLRTEDFLLAALALGTGMVGIHVMGVAALHTPATLYYEPRLFALALLFGFAAALVGAVMGARFRRNQDGLQAPSKLIASLLMGVTIAATFIVSIKALVLVVPAGASPLAEHAQSASHLGLPLGLLTLALIGTITGASLADRKLQRKEQDLARMNMLLGQLDRARDSLQQLANYDHLTNLFNRRSFTEQFTKRLAEHENNRQPLAILFLDVDHFKRVNETLGHDAGDELLKIVAKRIRAVLRSQDLIARFGGDEFCILSPLTERSEAVSVAQRIMQKMKEPIAIGGRTVVMTASVGICLYPEDGQGSEELLKNADLAMYQAKGNGRNTVHLFSTHLKHKASLELQIEEDLRGAIATDALTMYYQPVMDLKSGKIVKLEALVRWQHSHHGLLTPDRFVSIAEINGFIDLLDAWTLRRACRELKELHLQGFAGLKVAVNCSALNLGHENLPANIEETLRQESLAPGFLELEVTENALMANIGKAAAVLSHMRELGMGLSIDDFGTGYSSLAYLKSLPIHTLKVDRSFIKDIPSDSSDMEITAAIIAMAHKLNLKVIAEGAETQAQMQFLRENGCDLVQGYYISRPLPLNELKTFLRQYQPPVFNHALQVAGV